MSLQMQSDVQEDICKFLRKIPKTRENSLAVKFLYADLFNSYMNLLKDKGQPGLPNMSLVYDQYLYNYSLGRLMKMKISDWMGKFDQLGVVYLIQPNKEIMRYIGKLPYVTLYPELCFKPENIGLIKMNEEMRLTFDMLETFLIDNGFTDFYSWRIALQKLYSEIIVAISKARVS